MIVVIADDITGAAELAGISLRYGLRVLLSTEVAFSVHPEVLVIATNTRSMSEGDAVQTMRNLTEQVKLLKPSLFYKKTDSVLRGHVVAELEVQMQVLVIKKALLVPANPLLGRTIKNGQYLVNGLPVHQAGFSSDPEFPIGSSHVKEILRCGTINVLKPSAHPPDGISVGEAESMNDIEYWASQTTDSILVAGAASFFASILGKKYRPLKGHSTTSFSKPLLLVSGTTFHQNVAQRKLFPHLVSYMPPLLLQHRASDEGLLESWAGTICNILVSYGKAIVAVGDNVTEGANPETVREKLSAVTKKVLQKTVVKELLVEGGSTAFAILEKLGIHSFTPTDELQQGVVRLKAEEKEVLHITIKPGSYAWPKEWDFTV